MLTGDKTVTEKAEMPELVEEEVEHGEQESTDTKEENNSMQELIKLLQERLNTYEIAEEMAKRKNETGKARRYNRGIKMMKEMLVSVQSGRSINEADIPPVLPSSATAEPTVENKGNISLCLLSREYLFLSLFVISLLYLKIKKYLICICARRI